MSKTVIAVFDSIGRAREAVQALSETGLVNERMQVQTGEELFARAQRSAGGRRETARSAIDRFFADLGIDAVSAPLQATSPLAADDAVIVVEAADERAEEAARVLDRHGAIDLNARSGGSAEATPPLRGQVEMYEDIDERALVAREAAGGQAHRARIYASN